MKLKKYINRQKIENINIVWALIATANGFDDQWDIKNKKDDLVNQPFLSLNATTTTLPQTKLNCIISFSFISFF